MWWEWESLPSLASLSYIEEAEEGWKEEHVASKHKMFWYPNEY